jgi:hypothetical protein
MALSREEALNRANAARRIPDDLKSVRSTMLMSLEVAEGYGSQSPAERGRTYSIGQRIEKNGNLVLYEILVKICKKHQTYGVDGILFINTEYGEYQDTNHAKVLLVAIEDAIAALNNVREPLLIGQLPVNSP